MSTAVTCANHPESPADAAGADYGPPLCEECAAAFGLPCPMCLDGGEQDD